MFSYAASKEMFPEQLHERFGKDYRMVLRQLICFLMRLPKNCSPNNRTSDSGNTIQWRQDNRCVSCKVGAWREDNTLCTYSELTRLPMMCSLNSPSSIWGSLFSGGVRLTDDISERMISPLVRSHASFREVFPEQSDKRFGEHHRMAQRLSI